MTSAHDPLYYGRIVPPKPLSRTPHTKSPPTPHTKSPPRTPRAKSPRTPRSSGSDGSRITKDPKVRFSAHFVKGTKQQQRQFVADHAYSWLELQAARGIKGCVVFDIDDTLINGHEAVSGGFEFMLSFFHLASELFPVHIVTARPDSDHRDCMRMLKERGLCVPPDRLHMLPEKLYGKGHEHVEKFKWECHKKFVKMHGFVLARFGDKLWDVATLESLTTYLKHVADRDCYVFFDPKFKGTLSGKLPGAG